MHRDLQDCRRVAIELNGCWHELPWNGLPPNDEISAFSDSRVRADVTGTKLGGAMLKGVRGASHHASASDPNPSTDQLSMPPVLFTSLPGAARQHALALAELRESCQGEPYR